MNMPIIHPVIRPPVEANSFLLQVTVGCSSDLCTFCGAYKSKRFRLKDEKEIWADIEHHAYWHKNTRRIFLMDGDALVLNNEKLIPILKKLQESFPLLTRVSSYANGYNITARSKEELEELSANKLTLIYIGLESGSQAILDQCRKKSSAQEMITAVQMATSADIKSSVIVLLGLGGKKHSAEHIKETIVALNHMQPRYLSFLSLMVIPGTPLEDEINRRQFEELTSDELLGELYEILKGVELKKTIFRSNHASNYLPLEGSLPKDKEKLLTTIENALKGNVRLRPEFFRGL